MAKAYIILSPRVDSNPSDQYRVAKAKDWLLFRRGVLKSYPYQSYSTYKQAQLAADGKL